MDRDYLDGFFKWLGQEISQISKRTASKSKLQALLLGIGLFLRDQDLALFTDDETIVPGHFAKSCIHADDWDVMLQILHSMREKMNDDLGCVLLNNWILQILTTE